ncbi:eCIS core domain-containing protein [Nostoc sp. CALU 1950]|uniref:eCIS core domain-containing protein n=1 Tax=Nostoc sp. CALU 1950 TaxID=3104321 RepID=UPI003EB978D4
MYQKQIFQKVAPSLPSTPISKEIASSPSYGSLSSVVQRVQQDPNSVSGDERQELESAIGTRSTQNILAGKQTQWVPEFQGISAQLWDDAGQVDAPIQAKGNDDVGMSEVQPENRTGLPDNLKAGIENLSGMVIDDVKVHYNSSKPAELQALAYTQGTDIYVAPGQEQHLPHEAWHIVQQAQGHVKPTRQMKSGISINDDKGLEHEADVMGAKAMSASYSLPRRQLQLHASPPSNAPIQGFFQVDSNRISENMNIVWEGQKDVYATATQFTTSNLVLDIKGSKYLLHQGVAKNYGGNTTYYRVEPRLNPRTTTAEEQDLQPTMGDDDEMLRSKHESYMQELRWVEEDLEEFKNDFDNEISHDPNWRKKLSRKRIIGMRLNNWCRAAPYRHDLLFIELAQVTLEYENHESLETMTRDIAKVQVKFHAFVNRENAYPRAIALPNDCAQCVSELVGGEAARERGNKNPDIGGNYHETLRSPKNNALGWNFHWAGVIMKDGGDNVSLESAAGMSMTNYDRQTWWFAMYGTQKPEQTFKHQIQEFHYKRNISLLLKQLPNGIENYRFGTDFGLILDIQQMKQALKDLNGDG